MKNILNLFAVLYYCLVVPVRAFAPAVLQTSVLSAPGSSSARVSTALSGSNFDLTQRFESLKCLVIGAIVGSFALAPVAAIHDVFLLPSTITTNGLAQWEFDNDMASLQTGLFAIVYRYCIREDENPQLNQGVIAAFVVTRTLSRIIVSPYCTAIVLDCGPPLGYFDWPMLGQALLNGAESAAMFIATAAAIDYAMKKEFISKFPG